MSDKYSVGPETECDDIPVDMRRAVMQTAFTDTAKQEHLVNLLRRYDRMLRNSEDRAAEARKLLESFRIEPFEDMPLGAAKMMKKIETICALLEPQ